MLNSRPIATQLKEGIDLALSELVKEYLDTSTLSSNFPGIASTISEYALCKGKRIRAMLFLFAYLAIKKEPVNHVFHSAASLELLHLFALIHDDIIDSSETRRGNSALHKRFDKLVSCVNENTGQYSNNLAIVIGDTLYSFSIAGFLKVEEAVIRKQMALESILDAAIKTGNGQVLELLYNKKPISTVSLEEIFHIYNCKTSAYTFSGPLTAGAALAGAPKDILTNLIEAGICMGSAYQMLDDLNECEESLACGCVPEDLKADRKTVLLWHVFNNSSVNNKELLSNDNTRCNVSPDKWARLFKECGTFQYVSQQIDLHFQKALSLLPGTSDCFKFSEDFEPFLVSLFSHNNRRYVPIANTPSNVLIT